MSKDPFFSQNVQVQQKDWYQSQVALTYVVREVDADGRDLQLQLVHEQALFAVSTAAFSQWVVIQPCR